MADKNFTRDDFMDFFRNEEQFNTLSNDDRIEVFMSITPGNSDLTKELLTELLTNYNIDPSTLLK